MSHSNLPNQNQLIGLINQTEENALKKGDSLIADVGGYRFSPELWIHSKEYETELRIVLIGGFLPNTPKIELKISRALFQNKRVGAMTRVFFYLLNFCRKKDVPRLVVESVLTKEMANWCTKYGFHQDPCTIFLEDGIGGNYIFDVFDPSIGNYDYMNDQIPEHEFERLYESVLPVYEGKLSQSRYEKDLPFISASLIHERAHCERVLLFALWLARFYNLNEKELFSLTEAALYHDIGRTNDWMDEEHGGKSAELYAAKTKEADETTLFLMKYHCQDDFLGWTKALSMEQPERKILLLNILKDADALDRFRLGPRDLRIHQFRLPESRRLTSYAKEVVELGF